MSYDPSDDSRKSYDLAVAANREKLLLEIPGVKRARVIGRCELLQGDAMQVLPKLGPVDSLVTDPPYGMAFRSNHRKERHGFIANDDEGWAMQWACGLGVRHSKYVWMRWDNLASIPRPRSLVTWVKNNHSMGDLTGEHARKTEVCAFYRGPEHFFPGLRPTDVIEAPRMGNEHHPTEKPVSLMEQVVRWTDGEVFDPFMGSGTTLVACAKLGRRGIGIELDEGYFDIACKRVTEAYRQPELFIEQPAPQPKQEAMDL